MEVNDWNRSVSLAVGISKKSGKPKSEGNFRAFYRITIKLDAIVRLEEPEEIGDVEIGIEEARYRREREVRPRHQTTTQKAAIFVAKAGPEAMNFQSQIRATLLKTLHGTHPASFNDEVSWNLQPRAKIPAATTGNGSRRWRM